jgi:hypothetical protein
MRAEILTDDELMPHRLRLAAWVERWKPLGPVADQGSIWMDSTIA